MSVGDQVPLGGTFSLLRRERLLLVAGAFALAAMVEGGIELWGVLFLRTYLASGVLIGAGGRCSGTRSPHWPDSRSGRPSGARGPARGVTIGAGRRGTGGVAVLATAGTALFAAIGLVLAAGGISMCWPLLLAQAGAGRARAGAVVGAVSAVGYLGLVMGPAIVGWVAEAAASAPPSGCWPLPPPSSRSSPPGRGSFEPGGSLPGAVR